MFCVLLYVILLLLMPNHLYSIGLIPPGANFLSYAKEAQLWHPGQPLKIHLGCGESHYDGFINIDFPASEHTIQTRGRADVFADITQLAFPALCLDEVKSHHLFEHFPRDHALALLATWHFALKVGGVVTIETPDFEQSIHMLTSPHYSYQQKQIIMRHIFGSHEAYWAMHYDGWYQEKFRHILSAMGFEVTSITKSSYLVLHNITVQARKIQHLDSSALAQQAKAILRESMVNSSETEEIIWRQWCSGLDKHIAPCIIH